MIYEDDNRYAVQRARYLARKTDLRQVEGETVAYCERGYSTLGIAKRTDTTQSTVQDYLELAEALYGWEATTTKVLPGEQPPDLEQVSPGYHRTLKTRQSKLDWLETVRKHESRLPQEWVAKVLAEAREDGFTHKDTRSK
ncbi:hypothetical protein E6P09_05985 [Haloferax mediterranei ATCC 33500]|uniref:Uncharacterized protein n=1 Tax=Haloferax mediterranei (strain ATCC 33500 / DSM 1411 / JCM 8866 / NBRC 14739 / NCIMB 2177 / R-4) TaxID=523841 RepID=I3R254_HALMT|nr:hypothetical protein [Haloferax mediterranei]AFK18314.1 hypothetical protein HFX_0589 [Haloferax mediterranei ATCC 33500]MDX5988402.1 hypothetical protein [Haloferax mediterranei ATCC 33500]QCQ74829.1 hypothetical protein E6P09_05985 [Haloferax mediterranei ATCC 33500]